MTNGCSAPFSSRKVAPIDSEYFVPSWKTWLTSMPRAPLSSPPHSGQPSPGSATTRSAHCVDLEVASGHRADEVVVVLVGADAPRDFAFERPVGDDERARGRRRPGRASPSGCRRRRSRPRRAARTPGTAQSALTGLSSRSPGTQKKTSVPSAVLPAIVLTVSCSEMPRNVGELGDRADPGRVDLLERRAARSTAGVRGTTVSAASTLAA